MKRRQRGIEGPSLFDLPIEDETPREPDEETWPDLDDDFEPEPVGLPFDAAGDVELEDEEGPVEAADVAVAYPHIEVHLAAESHLAPFGPRALAGLLDFGVTLALGVIVVIGTWWMGVRLGPFDWPAVAIFLAAFSFLYHVMPLAFWGQTPGMAVAGVTARGRDLEPLSLGQTIGRWLGAVVTVLTLGLPLLSALTGTSFIDRVSNSRTLLRD